MNGISHKQAIKWIHRRLDGLLTQSQVLQLDEHLDSCDTCRAYAVEINSLPVKLEKEFRARWDHQPGPSQNVMEHVMAKARNIPMRRRISSGAKLLAGGAALIMLGFLINGVVSQLQSTSTSASETEMANNSVLAESRLLAFSSEENGNYDIYTMRADGNGLTNITNHPALDAAPFWSPDGKHIAFMSDRDSSTQIYLMNFDGSNVIQLTSGGGDYFFDVNGYSPWSPDGSKLIFLHEKKLYVLDISDKSITTLTNEPGSYFLPSWSPDGSYIAFISDTGRIPQDLFIVGSDGSNLIRLTENLPPGEFFLFDYVWSQRGTLSFITSRNQQVFQNATYFSTVYEANIDGSLTVMYGTNDRQIIDWWNGITVQETESDLTWLRPDGSQSKFDLCETGSHMLGIAHQRSHRGNLVVGSNCSDKGWMLYWANPDGSIIDPLLSSPIPATTNTDYISALTWSSDDRYLAFISSDTTSADVINTLYVLDLPKAREDPSTQAVKISSSYNPSWQPMLNDQVVEENPTPAPTQDLASGGLIAFASDQNGNSEIYTMIVDGNGLINLTNHPAQDSNPVWSPDGTRIAFESDRDGFRQIYLMNADGSGVIQLTHDQTDHYLPMNIHGNSNPWSPDGNKLLLLKQDPGVSTSTLYSLDMHSGDMLTLASGSVQFNNLAWSPDGQFVGYVLNDSATPASTFVTGLYVVNSAGSTRLGINELLPQTDSVYSPFYYWSRDGDSIIFIAHRHLDEGKDQWIAYEAVVTSQQLIERAISSTIMDDWWEGTSFIHGMDLSTLTWLRSDGTFSTFKPLEICDLTVEASYGFLARRSPSGNQVFNVYCPNKELWFYYASSDGTVIKPLMNAPISSITPDTSVTSMTWSPDDRFIAITQVSATKSSLYILNVREPSAQPEEIVISDGEFYAIPSWQPVP